MSIFPYLNRSFVRASSSSSSKRISRTAKLFSKVKPLFNNEIGFMRLLNKNSSRCDSCQLLRVVIHIKPVNTYAYAMSIFLYLNRSFVLLLLLLLLLLQRGSLALQSVFKSQTLFNNEIGFMCVFIIKEKRACLSDSCHDIHKARNKKSTARLISTLKCHSKHLSSTLDRSQTRRTPRRTPREKEVQRTNRGTAEGRNIGKRRTTTTTNNNNNSSSLRSRIRTA